VAGYSGDAGDAMTAAYDPSWNANGNMFSSPGRDNDVAPGNCAVSNECSWWFGWCSANTVNLEPIGIWTTGSTLVYEVQASRMLVRLDT